MTPLLRCDVDTAALFAALDAVGAGAAAHVKSAAKETAEAIAGEARARVRRATGATAEGITIEETHDGTGYVVFVQRPDNPGLPGWIEHGTKFMPSRGFLFVSARLEEGPHLRRVSAAVDDAIRETGLGD
jgi:hypothetical protein